MSAERTVKYAVRRPVDSNGLTVDVWARFVSDLFGGWVDEPQRSLLDRVTAERFVDASAAQCEVARITTIVEPVGLRWDRSTLLDGTDAVGAVVREAGGDRWFWFLGVEHVRLGGTLDEAKAAAEAAYKATWGDA